MNIQTIISILFCFYAHLSLAQKSDIEINPTPKMVGTMLATGENVKAIEYTFDDRIHESYIDTNSGHITLQLRGLKNDKWLNNKGHIIHYDYINNKVKWSKKVAYQVDNYEQNGSLMVKTSANKSYLINMNNGEPYWEVKNSIYYSNSKYNIGIGYKIQSSQDVNNTLQGISLINGKSLWHREINREHGWNNLFHVNDSILMIVSSGLHTINLKTGSGWDYDTKSGKNDYAGNIAKNTIGAVAGILTGTFVTSTGHDVIRDLVSNVIVDSTQFYFASKEKICRLDKNGNTVWFSYFPKDEASKSSIFIKNNKVFMVNFGRAFMGYRKLNFGIPFFSAFDQKTGKELFKINLSNEDKDAIEDYKLVGDDIYLTYAKKMEIYSCNLGKKLGEFKIRSKETGAISGFIGNQVFVQQLDGSYQSLNLSDTNRVYFHTDKNKILNFDKKTKQIDLKNELKIENIWIHYLTKQDLKFIAQNKKTLILDKNNKKTAEIEATNKATIIGSKLYSINEKSFTVIDLNNVLK
jgi:hypothetical protein